MSSIEERLNKIKDLNEERSQLQRLCFDKLNLDNVKKPKDIGRLKYEYDVCIKDNTSNKNLDITI